MSGSRSIAIPSPRNREAAALLVLGSFVGGALLLFASPSVSLLAIPAAIAAIFLYRRPGM